MVLWSDKEEQILRTLSRRGLTDEEIAQELSELYDHNRSEGAVQSKRLDMGIRKRAANKDTGDKEKQIRTTTLQGKPLEPEQKIIGQFDQIEKVMDSEWTRKNILALKYLVFRGEDDKEIADIIGDKTEKEVKEKKEELLQIAS